MFPTHLNNNNNNLNHPTNHHVKTIYKFVQDSSPEGITQIQNYIKTEGHGNINAALKQAVITAQVSMIQSLIERDARCTLETDLEQTTNTIMIPILGESILHVAVRFNDCEIIKQLVLKSRALDINEQNRLGQTPIHIASQLNSDQPLALLLNLFKTSINKTQTDNIGNNALHYAQSEQNYRHLIEAGFNISQRNNAGITPIDNVVKSQLPAESKFRIIFNEIEKLDAQQIFVGGKTLLHIAASLELNENIKARQLIAPLLNKNLNLLSIQDNDGRLPIHSACANKGIFMLDMVNMLAPLSAHVIDKRDNLGASALLLCATSMYLANDLFAYGAKLNDRDKEQNTIFHYAAKSKNPNMIAWIISVHIAMQISPENIAKIINYPNLLGERPLFLIAQTAEHTKGLEDLLQHQADTSLVDNAGNNIFHYAAKNPKQEILSYLINTIDKTTGLSLAIATNKQGKSPIAVAKKCELPNNVQLFDSMRARLPSTTRQNINSRFFPNNTYKTPANAYKNFTCNFTVPK